jgi:type IV pilus assembly protein PilX
MFPRIHRRRSGHQRGAVLVTSMLLLLVLTIIGITVMQMSRMQERMAGNSRDINLSFQAAEGALRNAEAHINALSAAPVPCTESPCEIWNGKDYYMGVARADSDWWADNGQAFDLEDMSGLKEPPQVAIEEIQVVSYGSGAEGEAGESGAGRLFYQVTARSTGGSGEAEVILQTTFTRPDL